MHKISELIDASQSYSESGRSANPTPTESQAKSPGMGWGAQQIYTGSQVPEGGSDTLFEVLKRWLHNSQDECGCSEESKEGMTTFYETAEQGFCY